MAVSKATPKRLGSAAAQFLSLRPYSPMRLVTMSYAENVGSQFLSLRQSIFYKALSRFSTSLKSAMFAAIRGRTSALP